jgi:hypothetical protein
MKFFASYADQDAKDLVYGGQIGSCKKLVEQGEQSYEDSSITKSGTASED